MSDFKGTPGPWSCTNEGRLDDCIHSEADERGEGDIICLSPIIEGYEASAKNWEANARLISAAPELLEACQTALAFVAGWAGVYQHDHGLPDFHPRHKEAIEQVKYAIAKATGDQP